MAWTEWDREIVWRGLRRSRHGVAWTESDQHTAWRGMNAINYGVAWTEYDHEMVRRICSVIKMWTCEGLSNELAGVIQARSFLRSWITINCQRTFTWGLTR